MVGIKIFELKMGIYSMAFLYRRDLELLGYDIELRKIKKKKLFTVLAYADLYVDNQTIACLATFFKFRNGVRIDIIYDENIERQIMNDYFLFMRKFPEILFEVFVRNTVKILASICGIIAYLYIPYILVTKSNSISYVELSNIVDMLVCIMLVMVVRTLLNTI